jgi:transcriptional regulator with XRE-family HTH domain
LSDPEQHRLVSVPEQLAAAQRPAAVEGQLSSLTGVDQGTISRLERGQINTSIDARPARRAGRRTVSNGQPV